MFVGFVLFLVCHSRLMLTNNQISALPESMGSLLQLRELNLAMNCLRSLPRAIGLLTDLTTVLLAPSCVHAWPLNALPCYSTFVSVGCV